jgi:hypothetical protein
MTHPLAFTANSRRGRRESDRGAPDQANLIDAEFNLILAGLSNYLVCPRQQRTNDFIHLCWEQQRSQRAASAFSNMK